MSSLRNLVQIMVVLGMLLVSACTAQAPATALPPTVNPVSGEQASVSNPPSAATPEPLPELDPAVQAGIDKCANVQPGQACLVEGPVMVTAQPERSLAPFKKPGQVLNLADVHTIKLGDAGSTKGMVMMSIPTEWSGGAFIVVAFGDLKLTNEVVYGTREFNPMQSLTLTTGPNAEGQAPTSGLFVASPDDGNLSTLVVNSVELSFGSGGLLTGQGGGLTIHTVWGSIGAWVQDRIIQVKRGFGLHLTHEEILHELAKEPYVDPDTRFSEWLKKHFGDKQNEENNQQVVDKKPPEDRMLKYLDELLKKHFGCKEYATTGHCPGTEDPAADKKMRALEELRKKQKAWKGGWWKMTYGPVTRTGECKADVVGDGGVGGDGEPYTTEIPICRGNNGNRILMYDSGTTYDRIGPNKYANAYVSDFDMLNNMNFILEGGLETLQIVSPTRMILTHSSSNGGECSSSSIIYLDFVRDDPNIRCGKILYVSPFTTPEAPTPTPEPKPVDPPVEGQYQVRIGTLSAACDPAAKGFAPSYTTAGLSLSPENNLVIDAASTKYELELSTLTYPYNSEKDGIQEDRFGIFTLQQPVDSTFGLTMSLVQMPDQQWSGSWLVSDPEATKLCGGSIDLLPPQ